MAWEWAKRGPPLNLVQFKTHWRSVLTVESDPHVRNFAVLHTCQSRHSSQQWGQQVNLSPVPVRLLVLFLLVLLWNIRSFQTVWCSRYEDRKHRLQLNCALAFRSSSFDLSLPFHLPATLSSARYPQISSLSVTLALSLSFSDSRVSIINLQSRFLMRKIPSHVAAA